MINKMIILVSSFIFLILLNVVSTLAWYEDIDKVKLDFGHTNYEGFTFNVSYNDSSIPNHDQNGILEVVGNKRKEGIKTIEDLQISITFTPSVTSYLRIRIEDAWELTRTYASGKPSIKYVYVNTPERYLFADGWVYDVNTNFVYYTALITKSDQPLTLNFVTSGVGIDTSASQRYQDSYRVSIDLFADVVQANRFQEIWGIPSIPVKEVTPNA